MRILGMMACCRHVCHVWWCSGKYNPATLIKCAFSSSLSLLWTIIMSVWTSCLKPTFTQVGVRMDLCRWWFYRQILSNFAYHTTTTCLWASDRGGHIRLISLELIARSTVWSVLYQPITNIIMCSHNQQKSPVSWNISCTFHPSPGPTVAT